MPGIEKPAPKAKPDLPVLNGRPKQVFVVQQFKEFGHHSVSGEKVDAWQDIATVAIAANVPRRMALKKALEDAGLRPGTEAVKLRALDVKSAEVYEPEAHQPPVEWRL
jgi:hypothetical protein